MNELTADTAEAFLRRFGAAGFGNLHDAVVRKIEVRYTPAAPCPSVSVEVSVLDREARADAGWVNVRLNVDGVVEFVLKEGPRTSCVVVFRLNIGFSEGRVQLDFSGSDEASSVQDRQAECDFLVVGQRCSWSVVPHSESPK